MLQRPTHPPRSASHALPSPNQLVARAWLAEAPPGVVVTVAASAIACIGLAVALAAAAAARRVAALDGSTARYAAAGARRASPLTRARRSAREHARGDACTALALLWLGLLLAPLPVSRLVLRACCAAFCRAAALFAPPPALRRPRSPPVRVCCLRRVAMGGRTVRRGRVVAPSLLPLFLWRRSFFFAPRIRGGCGPPPRLCRCGGLGLRLRRRRVARSSQPQSSQSKLATRRVLVPTAPAPPDTPFTSAAARARRRPGAVARPAAVAPCVKQRRRRRPSERRSGCVAPCARGPHFLHPRLAVVPAPLRRDGGHCR